MEDENTTLTPKEDKIATRCAAKYRGVFVRHANVIGWIGTFLFILGLMPFANDNIKIWIFTVAIITIFYSAYAELMIIVGKLYEKLYERLYERNNGN